MVSTMKLKLWVPAPDTVLLQDNIREVAAALDTAFGPKLFSVDLYNGRSITSYDVRLSIEFEEDAETGRKVSTRTMLRVIDTESTIHLFELASEIKAVSAIWC